MMRQQVMRLFHPIPKDDKCLEGIEWTSVEDGLPDCTAGLFQVKLDDGETLFCFYYQKKADWLLKYMKEGFVWSHWWHTKEDGPVYGVTHYREVKET